MIEIRLPPPVLKTSVVSSGVEARPGIVISGASLTATRLRVTESQPHIAPPAPVAPLSVIERSRVSVGAGESEPTVYRTVAPPTPARSELIWARVPVNVRVGELFPAIVTPVAPAVAVSRPEIDDS